VHRAHVGDLQQSLPLRVVEVAPMVISRVISSSRPSFVSRCATDHRHRRAGVAGGAAIAARQAEADPKAIIAAAKGGSTTRSRSGAKFLNAGDDSDGAPAYSG
jgi:hypothetical protein